MTGTAAVGPLEGHALACRRGGRLVFEALSFRLEAGEALILRGPNGCGKSSLLRLLAGFAPASAGRVTWAGEDVAMDPPTHRRRLRFLGHLDAVKALLTVAENLRFAAALDGPSAPDAPARGGPADAAAGDDPALAPLALKAVRDVPGRLLSSGQRRRVAASRLFHGFRPLWLLDEPGVGLDRASRRRLETAIEAQRGRGGIVVVATHGDVGVDDPLVLDFAG